MRPLWSKKFVFLVCTLLFSTSLSAACSTNLVKKQKNIEELFAELRSLPSHCGQKDRLFLEFANRAYLGGHYVKSLWAVETALQRQKRRDNHYWSLKVLEGKNLNALNRFEEAIEVLRPMAIQNKADQASSHLKQRAHLALIESYYLRAGRNKDKNVFYLISLFMSRHPNSRYQPLLRDWLAYAKK